MTDLEYKRRTLREFDAAAEKFDDNDPSVYNLFFRQIEIRTDKRRTGENEI